jgi:ATP-binding cassette subfamily B (MDR/TAP) protein 1
VCRVFGTYSSTRDRLFLITEVLGQYHHRLQQSVNLVGHGIGEKLGIAISGISTFVSAFIVALAVQWKLTLITMCIILLLVIVTGVTVWIDAKQEARILRHYAKAASLAEEVFSSIQTVHTFWAHERLLEKLDDF